MKMMAVKKITRVGKGSVRNLTVSKNHTFVTKNGIVTHNCNAQNILILNGILEGKGYYNPKTCEFIAASPGFNIIATANSKGYGDETGKYLSQILDSAFLERFPVTFEQTFAPINVETKILKNHCSDNDFVEKLIKWATVIRKTFEDGGIDEIVSTRRLVHIVEAYSIFEDKLKSINLCSSRFEKHVKEAFIDLYSKIDEDINFDTKESQEEADEKIPF